MPAVWHALAVVLPRSAVAEASRSLLALGATGLMEDVPTGTALRFKQPWDTGRKPRPPATVMLRAWFRHRPEPKALAMALPGREVAWTEEPEQDWNEGWKVHFQPIHVSDRLVIAAPWHGGPNAVVIEPGNAFGTGEHRTTRSCLAEIDRLATPGGSCLDVGCGSGILALAAAHLGMRAYGMDIDEDAVEAARIAAAANGLLATFDARPIAEVEGSWDLVVANLYAEVIAALAVDLRRLARGHLVFAGILSDRAHLVEAAMSGLEQVHRDDGEGWTSLTYRVPA